MCNIEDQGDLKDYIDVNVRSDKSGMHLTQPHLINQIVQDADVALNENVKSTPAPTTVILSEDTQGKPFNQ